MRALFAWCKFMIVFIPVTDLVIVMQINYYYYYYCIRAFDWYQPRWPWMTLNGVIALILRFSSNSIALLANYVTVVEDRPINNYRTNPSLQRGLSAIAELLVSVTSSRRQASDRQCHRLTVVGSLANSSQSATAVLLLSSFFFALGTLAPFHGQTTCNCVCVADV